jgi:hypothetical protein
MRQFGAILKFKDKIQDSDAIEIGKYFYNMDYSPKENKLLVSWDYSYKMDVGDTKRSFIKVLKKYLDKAEIEVFLFKGSETEYFKLTKDYKHF